MPPSERDQVRKTLRLSVLEGCLWAVMVGLGEVFFVADALRLGASKALAAVVAVMPLALGSLGALASLWALRRVRSRRQFVTSAVGAQIGALVVLATLDFVGANTPYALMGAATVYHFCGQSAGPAWSSWMGEIVPVRLRGRYFSRRNRWLHLFTFVGLLAGGSFLELMDARPIDDGLGFACLFSAAAIFRLGSLLFLSRGYEPAYAQSEILGTFKEILRAKDGEKGRRLVLGSAVVTSSVYIASPHFVPFQLVDLGFSYVQYTLSQSAVVLGKVLAMPLFGARVDRLGPAPSWLFGGIGAALVPLPWVWVSGLGGVAASQAWSGVSWGAYEVAQLSLLLRTSNQRSRAMVFALQAVMNGLAQAVGTAFGALLLSQHVPVRAIFVISAVLRLLAISWAWRFVRHEKGRGDPRPVRMTALRPDGGAAFRPILGYGREEEKAP